MKEMMKRDLTTPKDPKTRKIPSLHVKDPGRRKKSLSTAIRDLGEEGLAEEEEVEVEEAGEAGIITKLIATQQIVLVKKLLVVGGTEVVVAPVEGHNEVE